MMNKQTIDKNLIECSLKGDRGAFDEIVLKYQHRLAHTLWPYIHEAQEIQDILQESFLHAYQALPEFKWQSEFYTWLYKITLNTAKNHLKARHRKVNFINIDNMEMVDDYMHALEDNQTPEEFAISDEDKTHIVDAFNALPPDLRESLMMRELDGLSYQEIAKRQHCPIGTVRSRIARARASVDEHMKHYESDKKDS